MEERIATNTQEGAERNGSESQKDISPMQEKILATKEPEFERRRRKQNEERSDDNHDSSEVKDLARRTPKRI